MKKIISIILCLLLAVSVLTGCAITKKNPERDFNQIIATIKPITTVRSEKRVIRDENGMPVTDVYGEVLLEPAGKRTVREANGAPKRGADGSIIFESVTEVAYTSNEVNIYKSQLVNYVNYYLSSELENMSQPNKTSVKESIDKFFDMLVSTELLIAEADRLFDAGVLYWTTQDVEDIQNSVYSTINDGILQNKNQLLTQRGLPTLAPISLDTSELSTTYPIMPEPDADNEEKQVFAEYKLQNDTYLKGEYQWFDSWYTNDQWAIEDVQKHGNTYPGLYGSSSERSLDSAAFGLYVDYITENAKNLIGTTDEEKQLIEDEVNLINNIRKTKGVEYVYPMLGKTLTVKFLIGNATLKNQKLAKLEEYITQDITTVTEVDIQDYYNKLVAKQKISFKNQSAYDAAVSNGDTILFTPSQRYVYVKHILLPFSDQQKSQLNEIKEKYGASNANISDKNKALIEEERFELAKDIVVYQHIDGEDDIQNPKTVNDVMQEIVITMDNVKGDYYSAERAFNRLIYKYNTDPGIFDNEKGYSVVYKLESGEEEQYMIEFAQAARAFRDEDYSIGQIYFDNEKDVPYIITDYGIHVMYYCADPAEGDVKRLDNYLTSGRYTSIYDLMKNGALEKARHEAYDRWEKRYIGDNKEEYSVLKNKRVNSYSNSVAKQIFG